MTHARQQIRNRIAVTTLGGLAAQTGAGEIYKSRARPVTKYPSITVYNASERLDVENPGYVVGVGEEKRYRRLFAVNIEVAVQTNDNPDDALDALCSQIETSMAQDDDMGGGVIATDLLSVSFTREGSGEEAVFTALMAYQVEFRTPASDAGTFLA